MTHKSGRDQKCDGGLLPSLPLEESFRELQAALAAQQVEDAEVGEEMMPMIFGKGGV